MTGKIKYPFHALRTTDTKKYRKLIFQTKDGKESHRISHRRYVHKCKQEIFRLLGGKCAKCGIKDVRLLQIDHIYGGGTQETIKSHGPQYSKILKEIKNNSNKYQLLCANCNWLKRYEGEEQN